MVPMWLRFRSGSRKKTYRGSKRAQGRYWFIPRSGNDPGAGAFHANNPFHAPSISLQSVQGLETCPRSHLHVPDGSCPSTNNSASPSKYISLKNSPNTSASVHHMNHWLKTLSSSVQPPPLGIPNNSSTSIVVLAARRGREPCYKLTASIGITRPRPVHPSTPTLPAPTIDEQCMQRRAVKTKHAPCRRPVRRVCRTGPLSTYCNATQQRNRARAQAASVVKKAAAAINTIGVWSGVVCRRSSSRSRCCSGNGVQRESVTGGRSFMIQTWPGPPSRRACVSSTRECGTSSALIPSMPARRTAFSCQVVNNKTKTKPHGGGKEQDRPHHHDVPWLRARLALPWRRSKHPRTRSGARRHLDRQPRQSVQSRFSGDRAGETLLDPPSFFRTSSDLFPSHPPRFSDRSAVAWPSCRNMPLAEQCPPGKPSTSHH